MDIDRSYRSLLLNKGILFKTEMHSIMWLQLLLISFKFAY